MKLLPSTAWIKGISNTVKHIKQHIQALSRVYVVFLRWIIRFIYLSTLRSTLILMIWTTNTLERKHARFSEVDGSRNWQEAIIESQQELLWHGHTLRKCASNILIWSNEHLKSANNMRWEKTRVNKSCRGEKFDLVFISVEQNGADTNCEVLIVRQNYEVHV